MPVRPLIILGASARAAAQWAIAQGFAPWCIDLFADRDLQAIAPVKRCPMDRYPHGIVDLLADAPIAPVLLTGRMENHLDVVNQIVAKRPLLHSPLDAIRRARLTPLPCREGQGEGGPSAYPQPSTHLIKSHLGRRPRFHHGEPLADHEYLQPFIAGESLGVVYEDDRCLGASIQIIDHFRYIGSLGPIPVTPGMVELGRKFAHACGLRGLWGIDMIRDPDGNLHPVEINPRFTASVEVHTRGMSKRIAFAKCDFIAPDLYDLYNESEIADVPAIGQPIRRGEPICTFFTSGGDARALERLHHMADRLYTRANV